jgi:hypothetical protein
MVGGGWFEGCGAGDGLNSGRGKELANSHQLTGNSGLQFASWQLSRRGWHAMPTVRNARGSDIIVTNSDETVFFGVQSKALSKRDPVPLGTSLENLRSKWWIITIKANSDQPICFILSLEEVKERAIANKSGKQAYWLQPTAYDHPEFREAWHRLGDPASD